MRWCTTFLAAAAMTLLVATTAHAQGQDEPPAEVAPAEESGAPEEGEAPGDAPAPDDQPPGEEAEPGASTEPPGEVEGSETAEGDAPSEEPPADEEPEQPLPEEPPAAVEVEASLPATEVAAHEETVVEPELGEEEGGDDGEEGPPPESDESGRQRIGAEETWSNSLPFRNSTLTYENVFSAYQLNRGADITYNPYYAMSLSFQPRWYFTDRLSLRLGFDLETELTNADDTTDYHETRVSDLRFDLVYDPIVRIPIIDVSMGAGLRLQLPTSPQAQAETMYMAFGPQLRFAKVFDVLDGLLVFYSFRYMKHLNRYTTLQRQTNPYSCVRQDLSCLAHNQLGTPARSHGIFNQLLVNLDFLRQLRPMHVAFVVSFVNYLTYGVPEATVPLIGGAEAEVGHIEEPVTHRAAILYLFEVGVEVTDYLGLSVGASTMSPQLAPDSTYRQPFFNRYTNLYVDLSLDVERLVAAFRQ